MLHLRFVFTLLIVSLLSIAPAKAVEVSLEDGNIARYFEVLEIYALPFLAVSTIVLFCGYLASRIYNRNADPGRDEADEVPPEPSREQATAAFLRWLKTTPPIKDPAPDRERRLRIRGLMTRKPVTDDETVSPPLRIADLPEGRDAEPEAPESIRRWFSLRAAKEESAQPSPPPEQPDIPKPDISKNDLRQGRSSRVTRTAPKAPRLAANGKDELAGSSIGSGMSGDMPGPSAGSRTESDLGARRGGNDEFIDAADSPSLGPAPLDPSFFDPAPLEPPFLDSASRRAEEPEKARPAVVDRGSWRPDSQGKPRVEPTVSVVQPLMPAEELSAASAASLDEARATAAEIVRALENTATLLKKCMVSLAEQIKAHKGLSLDNVQGMRIPGFTPATDIAAKLAALGPEAVSEVMEGYAAVDRFNRIVGRLEEMAAQSDLDEGWNDLVRARLSEMIHAIGQAHKRLVAHLPEQGRERPGHRVDKNGSAPGPRMTRRS